MLFEINVYFTYPAYWSSELVGFSFINMKNINYLHFFQTIYENCLEAQVESVRGSIVVVTSNVSDALASGSNSLMLDGNITVTTTILPHRECAEPWSLVPPGVFPVFWRIVYWTSQFLTWYYDCFVSCTWQKISSAASFWNTEIAVLLFFIYWKCSY